MWKWGFISSVGKASDKWAIVIEISRSCIQKSQVKIGVNLVILSCSKVKCVSKFPHFSLESNTATDSLYKCILISSFMAGFFSMRMLQNPEMAPDRVCHSQITRKFIIFFAGV